MIESKALTGKLNSNAGVTEARVGTLEAGAIGLTQPEWLREDRTRNQGERGPRALLGSDRRSSCHLPRVPDGGTRVRQKAYVKKQ